MHPTNRWYSVGFFVLIVILASGTTLSAQEAGTISGRVTGAAGEPLSSAQIFLEGTGYGVLSDESGRYVISDIRPGTYTVVVRMVGHAEGRRSNLDVRPGEPQVVDFELETDVLSIQGVVVTGLADPVEGIRVPFTVSRLDRQDIVAPSVNPMSVLQGRVAGARVVSGGGQPGSGISVRLRARNSVNTSEAPLVVVDGVVLGSDILDVDPNDIEDIEVIRGAAAASLYGSRAQAGVIQITTRRGREAASDQTMITARTQIGFNQVARTPAIADRHPFRTNAAGEYLDLDGNVVSRSSRVLRADRMIDSEYGVPLYNHLDRFFDAGQSMNTNVTLARNTVATNFFISLADTRETGVVPQFNDGYARQNLRFNIDHRVRPDLTLGFTTYHMRSTRQNFEARNPFRDLMFIAPDVDISEPNPDGTPFHIQPDPFQQEPNPLYGISVVDSWNDRVRTQGSGNIRYNPTSWLNLDGLLAYDRSDRESSAFYPKGYKTLGASVLNNGQYSRSHQAAENLNGHLQGTILNSFGDLAARVRLRYLFEREDFESQTATARDLYVGGIPSLNAGQQQFTSGSAQAVRSEAVMLNAGLDYAGKYIGDFLVRRDVSSLFGPGNRWHNYYRASLSYLMSEESWWPSDFITAFKPRYSIGTAGSRPGFSWRYETWNVGQAGPSKGVLGNRNLRPEHATEQDFGLDMIFRDRVSLQLTYATSVVEDQLIPIPLPGFYGYSSQYQNAGTVETSAIEATLEAALVQRPDFTWSMGLVADRARSTLTDWQRTCYTTSTFYRCEGEDFGTMRTRRFLTGAEELPGVHAGSSGQFQVNDDGYLVAVGDFDFTDGMRHDLWGTSVVIDGVTYGWGMPIEQRDEDGNVDHLAIVGTAVPDLSLGWSNDVNWRGIRFTSLWDFQIGGNAYNRTRQMPYRDNLSPDQVQAGKADEYKKPIDYYLPFYAAGSLSSHFVEPAGFAKLRELSLSYRFDQQRLASLGPVGRLGMDGLTLSLVGRNLLTFTRYSGIDPEVGSSSAGGVTENPYDEFAYPHFRTITIGAQVQF